MDNIRRLGRACVAVVKRHEGRTRRHIAAVLAVGAAATSVFLLPSLVRAVPPGWRLVWSDDFDTYDEEKWQRTTSSRPANDSRQAYLPDQVGGRDGKLEMLTENEAAGGLAYRSGEVVSKPAQRYGRWEVRARIPTGRGMWPTIRLLPDASQGSPYKIDIVSSRGERPTVVASACHWGPSTAASDDDITIEYRATVAGELVSFPEGFHTYAVEWLEDQLRFYVDNVHHGTLYADEVGGFLSRQTGPMRLVIGTAVGGDVVPPPNETTRWPQRFLVDWVRVYEAADEPVTHTFSNGGFEAGGGTLAGWHIFGNRVDGEPNVLVVGDLSTDGAASLKLSGQRAGGESYSGVSQAISVKGDQRVRARLSALVRSKESLAGSDNRATMKIEFYKRFGDYFGSPAMLGFEERVIADGETQADAWKEHELVASVPDGAIEARLSIVFGERTDRPGAVHVDGVEFAAIGD